MSTEKQILANRQNALLSTGPVTPEGKARSSANALKSGLTGRTVLLPGDDAAAYAKLLHDLTELWKPNQEDEKLLLQKIVDAEWRLARIPCLQEGLRTLGHLEMGAQADEDFKDHTPEVRVQLLETRIYLHYEKQFRNLALQESRLRRQLDKDCAQLREIMDDRNAEQETERLQVIDALETDPKKYTRQFFRTHGFEFSDEVWESILIEQAIGDDTSIGFNSLLERIEARERLVAKGKIKAA